MTEKIQDPLPFNVVLPKWGEKKILDTLEKFRYLVYQTEMDTIGVGDREASIYHLMSHNYDDQIERVFEKGLVYVPMHRAENFRGFAHNYRMTTELNPNTMSCGVVAQDLETAKEFAEYYKNADHINAGLMLGYPECCCRAFVEYTKTSMDPVWEIACNTQTWRSLEKHRIVLKDIFWELQIHMRYFGARIIPWFPCSFVCEEAREKAKIWVDALKSADPVLFGEIESILKTPSTWDLYNSQVVVNKPPHKESRFMGYATSVYHKERRLVEFNPKIDP